MPDGHLDSIQPREATGRALQESSLRIVPRQDEHARLFRAGLLRYLTPEQLRRIESTCIGIGGAGGLGSNCAMILVRTGFRRLEIIDCDVIEPSNLNRQQYFPSEIGRPKVFVLAERLAAINPGVDIRAHFKRWSPETAERYFTEAHIIIEAFDQADQKHTFVDVLRRRGVPIVSGIGMAGLTEKRPIRRRRVGHLFIVGDETTDSHEGHPPMAPRVTACAAMMAEIVLDLALGLIAPRGGPSFSVQQDEGGPPSSSGEKRRER